MKIQSVHLENFGSYKTLDFDFQDQGLTLISGATGAGKSTLMDAIPWILFGQTAKGGKVDEIINWNSTGTTIGTIRLSGGITITRTRSPNDLLLRGTCNGGNRGRDVQDTQKKINSILGIDCDLYLSGAYFHEFSQTAQFFTTTAKGRRELCEQIVDLFMATNLQTKSKTLSKSLFDERVKKTAQLDEELRAVSTWKRLSIDEKNKAQEWYEAHARNKSYYSDLYNTFEEKRKRIISRKCPSCKTVLEAPKEVYDDSPNPYAARVTELNTEENPHQGAVKSYNKEIEDSTSKIMTYKSEEDALKSKLSDIEVLQDVLVAFRTRLVEDTIQSLKQETNNLLLKHFDGEFIVDFNVIDDKLDVTIQKDGNPCVFTQLSKGQRQLLKLCFGVSVMKAVTNHSGVKFHQIFLDESLDGLSDTLKIKAFSLFQSLEQDYNSVFVIDHSEGLKALFDNQYKVELINGESNICHL